MTNLTTSHIKKKKYPKMKKKTEMEKDGESH